MDRTCVERRWTVERRAGGKYVGEKNARQTKDEKIDELREIDMKAGKKTRNHLEA